MSSAELPPTGTTAAVAWATTGGTPATVNASSDDGPIWYPPSDEAGYNPVTDIRLLRAGEPGVSAAWLGAVIDNASTALSMLADIDTTELDTELTAQWAHGVQRLHRQADAAGVAVADHLDTARPFRHQGYFTARTWMKQNLHVSGPQTHRHVQTARFTRRIPMWGAAFTAGQIGVEHMTLMARIAANERITDDTLLEGAWLLLPDAIDLPYADFETRARTWEALADPIGDRTRAERNRTRRNATIHDRPDGSWKLTANLDDLSGAEFLEVFA